MEKNALHVAIILLFLYAGNIVLILRLLSQKPRTRAEDSWEEAWKKFAIGFLLTLTTIVILILVRLIASLYLLEGIILLFLYAGNIVLILLLLSQKPRDRAEDLWEVAWKFAIGCLLLLVTTIVILILVGLIAFMHLWMEAFG